MGLETNLQLGSYFVAMKGSPVLDDYPCENVHIFQAVSFSSFLMQYSPRVDPKITAAPTRQRGKLRWMVEEILHHQFWMVKPVNPL